TDQWIFLPAINKARRISSSRKGGRFVGSDILYEDLRDRKVAADHHTLLGEEKINGIKALKLESVPVDADNSIYSKKISWVHPVSLVALRIDFFQGGKKPVKMTLVKQLEKKQGFWTVMKSVAIDLKSLHETHLKMHTVLYDQAIPSDLLSLRYLEDPQREKQLIRTLLSEKLSEKKL
ncbi:MAG: outer membrane lipoprotein-sorting protein, partial [Gammaproteobacteria bacterium]|nr:outer membrane lipoprotein-sorting protein [Gammaproteobacteria bacterium]